MHEIRSVIYSGLLNSGYVSHNMNACNQLLCLKRPNPLAEISVPLSAALMHLALTPRKPESGFKKLLKRKPKKRENTSVPKYAHTVISHAGIPSTMVKHLTHNILRSLFWKGCYQCCFNYPIPHVSCYHPASYQSFRAHLLRCYH